MATSKTTKLGTPCSSKWDGNWIESVDALENTYQRRCCGAHCPDGTPCPLKSSHKNGRCRYHGGVTGIGAPKGNLNARIHGLYSRRIQQCGGHCPMWDRCPFSGKDVLQMPESQRPLCPFETEEYELLTQFDEQSAPDHYKLYRFDKLIPHPLQGQVVMLQENLKMLQVMITRAGTALNLKGNTQETIVKGENYSMEAAKPSATLQALNMLTREHRYTFSQLRSLITEFGNPFL